MQIFELHFNPKTKQDKFFDSFIYEPEHSSEKKLGSLYIVGELQNALPQNSKLLDNLAQVVKANYYKLSYKSPDKALSEDLKKANQFLAQEVKKENVSWLGNLNFAVLSLKDSDLTFTKTGNLKILLIRGGQVTDLSKNLDYQDIEPYPLKVFFSVVSGKLVQDDIILVLTKEVFEFFAGQNILDRISKTEGLDKKTLREILPANLFNKGAGAKISGICFLAVLKKEAMPEKAIVFQKEEKFSFSQALSPILLPFQRIKKINLPQFQNPLKFLKKSLEKKKNKLSLPKINLPKIAVLKRIPKKVIQGLPFISQLVNDKKSKTPIKKEKSFFTNFSFLLKGQIKKQEKNKVALLFILIFVLLLGFLIFKKAEEIKENKIKIPLSEIEEKFNLGESFLILKNQEKANALFKEAWLELLPLTEKETPLKPRIFSLKESLEEHLNKFNKLEKIENPQQVSGPEYQKLLTPITPPENLIPLADPDFNFDLSASYLSNLYFLDKEKCEIIKYSYLSDSQWSGPKKWTRNKGPENACSNPKSMAIDGSVWILNSDNSLVRYHSGDYQETIKLDFFPFPENITKIKTKPNFLYLYLLEPINKRIIIIDKAGKIVKQFQSEKFDNLKDFAVSDNGKTIWLLNGDIIYKIEI